MNGERCDLSVPGTNRNDGAWNKDGMDLQSWGQRDGVLRQAEFGSFHRALAIARGQGRSDFTVQVLWD